MQHRRDDFERMGPFLPQGFEEIQGENVLENGAGDCRDAAGEGVAQEYMRRWIDTVEDHGGMRQEFAHDVQGSCVGSSQ